MKIKLIFILYTMSIKFCPGLNTMNAAFKLTWPARFMGGGQWYRSIWVNTHNQRAISWAEWECQPQCQLHRCAIYAITCGPMYQILLVLSLMLCCHCLEILNSFVYETQHFHFIQGLCTSYEANPDHLYATWALVVCLCLCFICYLFQLDPLSFLSSAVCIIIYT